MTIQNCKHCNKELMTGERQIAEKTEVALCAECQYLQAIGVTTITQYNDWLKK
jgi:transcription elongation factor Elf1